MINFSDVFGVEQDVLEAYGVGIMPSGARPEPGS